MGKFEGNYKLMNFLIVGSGFTGATLAERLADAGERVAIIDRRSHIGGNAYDYMNEHDIIVHKYGPHIFHTDSKKIWNYLSQFTEWTPYRHKVMASVDGKLITLPVNFNTIRMMFPDAERIISLLKEKYKDKVSILKLMEDGDLKDFAQTIYNKIFYNYTVKQWGITPDELDPSVLARVPIRLSDNDDYFLDEYQGMPREGYTVLFNRMLSHENINVHLNRPFYISDISNYEKIIFTGCIDEFFDYKLGELPYRSLRFEFTTHEEDYWQSVGTVNYPNEKEFTRITEMKYLTGQKISKTTLCCEYPCPYMFGENEPYYPIPRFENRDLYHRYENLAAEWKGKIYFIGRLAEYKYYDMHQAVGSALSLFEKEFSMEEAA